MSALFTQSEIDGLLSANDIRRAWFGELDLPSGIARLHSGVGSVTIGGYEWRGVTDPVGGRIVSISGIREVVFGQAAAITIVLSGADRDFVRSVHATRREIEGRSANIYWCAFDAETQQPIGGLKPVFVDGYMSSPGIVWESLGSRTVTITIENIWSAKNFKPGGKWNPAGQRARFAGDAGLDFVGVKIEETIK